TVPASALSYYPFSVLILRRTPRSTLFPYTTLFRSDVDVVDGVVELAVDAAHAPRPRLAELLLEAEDQLVLVDLVHVGVDLGAQVTDGAVALAVVEAELLAKDRERVLNPVVLADLPALEAVERPRVEQRATLLDVDDVGDRQEVAADVAEQLGGAVATDVPREAKPRRPHVVHLDVGRAQAVL